MLTYRQSTGKTRKIKSPEGLGGPRPPRLAAGDALRGAQASERDTRGQH